MASQTASAQTITVVWIREGPVCVEIIDPPAACTASGVCHCAACHGTTQAELATQFFPKR